MHAAVGDRVVVPGRRVGEQQRRGQVVEVRGQDGAPPYVIRWERDGRQDLFFPGPDLIIEVEPGNIK